MINGRQVLRQINTRAFYEKKIFQGRREFIIPSGAFPAGLNLFEMKILKAEIKK